MWPSLIGQLCYRRVGRRCDGARQSSAILRVRQKPRRAVRLSKSRIRHREMLPFFTNHFGRRVDAETSQCSRARASISLLPDHQSVCQSGGGALVGGVARCFRFPIALRRHGKSRLSSHVRRFVSAIYFLLSIGPIADVSENNCY